MSHVFVRKSKPEDCEIVSANMRKEDVAEVRASHNMTPLQAITCGFVHSAPPYTVVKYPDTPVAMWGVVPEGRKSIKTGKIWLLGTPEIADYRFSFLRQCEEWVSRASEGYDFVYNAIDKRNNLHIRWLKWLKFSFIREIPDYGHEKLPFVEFVRIN